MPAYIPPYPPPVVPEYITSAETKPFNNVLQAHEEIDGTWVIKLITDDGVVNELDLTPQQLAHHTNAHAARESSR